MSEIPCTAWRNTSSASLNASSIGVSFATMFLTRSFGITITVSPYFFKSSSPRAACAILFPISYKNGFVTTATVSAPKLFAISAITGAAPVPVPPPIPAVINTMSASVSISLILSESSRAASLPTSGLAPAPSPLVSFAPICNFVEA